MKPLSSPSKEPADEALREKFLRNMSQRASDLMTRRSGIAWPGSFVSGGNRAEDYPDLSFVAWQKPGRWSLSGDDMPTSDANCRSVEALDA